LAKVLVVGGGPAGSLSAIALKDHEVLMVEEHQSAGFPMQCAGLISEECYGRLKRYSDCKLNEIRGAFFIAPSGKFVELEGKSKAVVIDRKILDRDLLEKASEFAEVWVKSKFMKAHGRRAEIMKMGERTFVEFDYLVGADGVYSRVARCFGFERPEVLSAVQVECRYEALSDDMVELFFGCSDGFFAYAVPIDEYARVGVVSKSNPLCYLKNLLRRISDRISGKILELNVGAIPIGLVEFVKEKVFLVGDSAGMVKPYTGGGLFYITEATEILAKTFPNLEEFRNRFVEDIGREIEFGMKIYRLYSKLDDEDYDFLIELARDNVEIAKDLHMDRPTTLLKVLPSLIKIVRRPKLLKKLLSVLAT